MAWSEKLADRIRERLAELPRVQEKVMMGGLVFMYKGKMCMGVVKDEMMCRIDPEQYESALERTGCHAMTMGSKVMHGYMLVDDSGLKSKKDFDYWINLCLEFNKKAKASKKKK